MTNKISRQQKLHRQSGEGHVLAAIFLVGLLVLLGISVYNTLQLDTFREETDAQLRQHEERIAMLDGNVAKTSSQVGQVTTRVESAEKSFDERKREVEGRTQTLQKAIQETKQSQEESQEQITAVGGRLEGLEEFKSDTTSKVGALGGEVEDVKEAVSETRAELDKTIAELSSVRGDLGVQSGLIATNGQELTALKALGDRNYYEFTLSKTRKPQRVGPISVKLSGTDRGKNMYSLELWADDKKIVKKQRSLLEPVQFYVVGSRAPYELVVNKVARNEITGYLATPKEQSRGSS